MTKDSEDTVLSDAASASLEQILSGGYDQIILPALRAIFGQTTSDRNPIVGTTGQTESFILNSYATLLNSLDVRGDIEFVLAEGLDPSEPILIYILSDLKLAAGVTLSTAHNMTMRASRVYGELKIIGTAGRPGRNGAPFNNSAGDGGQGTDRSEDRGKEGRDARETTPLKPGHSSLPGGRGPDGGRGGDGEDGQNGPDGEDGQDGNDIKLWVERFEDGGLFIDVSGGNAGAGGSGQDGGDGGDGGNAGPGGQGGDSAVFRSASDGGPGGNGGDGGHGGNGGRSGLNGRPGNGGVCIAWGPRHQNAKPPLPIRVNPSAGRPARRRSRHGSAGQGGEGGLRGGGGPGGIGQLISSSDGETGPSGRPGGPGRNGSAFTVPIPTLEGDTTPPNIDFGRHPSAELAFLTPFTNNTPIAFAPKSTVIDDWGEQAYFEGMQPGSIGPEYRFNGGRSAVTWSDGSDLMIAEAGLDVRGLLVDGYWDDLPSRWVELEIFCPTLMINIDVYSGNRLRIEKGRLDTVTGQTKWDMTPLVNLGRLSRIPTLLFDQSNSLGTYNRLRLMGEEVYLHSLLVIDCSDCRSLPDC